MPKPTENHRRLARFAGTWKGKEALYHVPGAPPAITDGVMDMRLAIDDFFIIQEYLQTVEGKAVYRGHGILSWDDREKNYAWYWVDSMGFVPPGPSRGQWEGEVMVLEHPPMGDRRGRYTYAFAGDALTFKIENSQDGGKTWHTFLTSEYKKG